MTESSEPLLQIRDLTIAFPKGREWHSVVERASLTIAPGETSALVGESGSGKTLLARALVDLMPEGARITQGEILFKGRNLMDGEADAFKKVRGQEIGFIFQEPLSSLNPAVRIGVQLTEALRYHQGLPEDACRDRAVGMLGKVQISSPEKVMEKYPHELSGGMRQRVMIATSLILAPSLLVADEPTTALDMIVQEEVLLLMKEIALEMGTAVLLITHDLGSVATLCENVSVMNRGAIVEQGQVRDILRKPRHDYTRKLLDASPQVPDEHAVSTQKETPDLILEVADLTVSFEDRSSGFLRSKKSVTALSRVSFSIAKGETLAIIGESGSGKTTLSRVIANLLPSTSGKVNFHGQDIQFIFQDPFGSLDPRMRVGDIVAEGLLFNRRHARADRRDMVAKSLEDVKLDASFIDRFPHQLSGGQRQRVSIARAIITNPDFIIADEPVSALDLTVQKQILELLLELKEKVGFACLFVSHDLGVVEHIADRVGVLYRGQLVEIGPAAAIFNRPRHAYTRRLLSATPRLSRSGQEGYTLVRRNFPNEGPDKAPETNDVSGAGETSYREVEAGHFVARGAENNI